MRSWTLLASYLGIFEGKVIASTGTPLTEVYIRSCAMHRNCSVRTARKELRAALSRRGELSVETVRSARVVAAHEGGCEAREVSVGVPNKHGAPRDERGRRIVAHDNKTPKVGRVTYVAVAENESFPCETKRNDLRMRI